MIYKNYESLDKDSGINMKWAIYIISLYFLLQTGIGVLFQSCIRIQPKQYKCNGQSLRYAVCK